MGAGGAKIHNGGLDYLGGRSLRRETKLIFAHNEGPFYYIMAMYGYAGVCYKEHKDCSLVGGQL